MSLLHSIRIIPTFDGLIIQLPHTKHKKIAHNKIKITLHSTLCTLLTFECIPSNSASTHVYTSSFNLVVYKSGSSCAHCIACFVIYQNNVCSGHSLFSFSNILITAQYSITPMYPDFMYLWLLKTTESKQVKGYGKFHAGLSESRDAVPLLQRPVIMGQLKYGAWGGGCV